MTADATKVYPGLTGARLRALQVVAAHNGTARESNSTDLDHGLVYWQSRTWLEEQYLIQAAGPGGLLRLRQKGRQVLAEADKAAQP